MDRPPVDKPLSLRADLLDPFVSLHWERCNNLPVRIASAHSVWLNNKLYVRGGVILGGGSDTRLLLVYTPSEDTWEHIPTPTEDYALATYHSQVVLVGGDATREPTNKVWLLEGCSCVPHPTIPDMPVSAVFPCAVSSGDYLIVAGGGDDKGTVVSVFDGQKWCCAQALPERLYYLQSAVNGNEWFLSGEKKVYRASLKSLIASAVSPVASQPAVWEGLPDTPHRYSGITWCGGHLLAVGGRDSHYVNLRSVYAYDTQAKVWEHVSDLPGDGCCDSSCAVLPTGELLVAGGAGAYQRVLKATIRGDADVSNPSKCSSPEASSILDDEPEPSDVISFKNISKGSEQTFKLRKTFSSTWRDLGRKFGFSGEELRAFATNNRDNPEQCFDDVISHWMSDGSVPFGAYPVTWGGLVQALEDVGGVKNKVHKLKIALQSKTGTTLLGKHKHPESSHSPSSSSAADCSISSKTRKLDSSTAGTSTSGSSKKKSKRTLRRHHQPVRAGERVASTTILAKVEETDGSSSKGVIKCAVTPSSGAAGTSEEELPGVDVIAEIELKVTSAGLSFYWAGYGLKLTFPAECLPPGVEECLLRIRASTSGLLPDDVTLVSAVYWVKADPSIIFEKQFTVEIQNCAKYSNFSELKFYRTGLSGFPYKFQPLECEVFTDSNSSYTSVQLDQFCGVAVGQEGNHERNCCTSLFYGNLGDTTD